MLHFLTGMYYFTWFENLLIIIAGLSLGHFLYMIVRQVVAIRNHKSLTKIIRTMIPWLVLLLVLMLSPVFASGIAVGWMVIIGLLECVIEQVVITKFGPQLNHRRTEHRPVRQQHTDHDDRPAHTVYHSAAEQQQHVTEHEQSAKLNSAAQQAQSTESAAKPAAPAAQQPAKSAESAPTTEHQSPAVTNQAASTTATATTESQPETQPAESHQPTSQEIMDHMFDFDPNVDYEAEAKAAAAADRQNQEEDTHDKD